MLCFFLFPFSYRGNINRASHLWHNIDLINVDKPGYKTYDDAADPNNPASNISYNITIVPEDGRNEILVSNGTYNVELEASRIYAKGYSNFSGTFQFTITPNDADENYQHPAIYVMADYGVDVTGCSYISEGDTEPTEVEKEEIDETGYADDQDSHVDDYWYKVEKSTSATEVTINYEATYSGRLRLRIGDILKFIPVRFDGTRVVSLGGTLSFSNESGTSFAYSQIEAVDTDICGDNTSILSSDGVVASNRDDGDDVVERQLRSRIYTDSGNAMLYFWQNVSNSDERTPDSTGDDVGYGNVVDVEYYAPDQEEYDVMSDEDKEDVAEDVREEIVDAVITALVDNEYTTVYIETDYYNEYITADGSATNQDNIFTSIEKSVREAIANNQLDEDYTYSIDLSGLNKLYDDPDEINEVFDFLYGSLFTGLTHLESLVLPSTIGKIKANSFYGCTSLKSVIIGSEDDPIYLQNIDDDAFAGMTKDATIEIFTTKSYSITEPDEEAVTLTTDSTAGTDGSVYRYVFTVHTYVQTDEGDALLDSLDLLLDPYVE